MRAAYIPRRFESLEPGTHPGVGAEAVGQRPQPIRGQVTGHVLEVDSYGRAPVRIGVDAE